MDRGYNYNLNVADNGNVMGITNYRDSSRTQSFTYDNLNRITSGWSTADTGALSWGENYAVDAWGNLTNQIWIGLAEVVPLPGCERLAPGKGAFVKVALWADSESAFCSRVENAISELDLQLIELEEREPLAHRISSGRAGDESKQMAEAARMNPGDVVFGTFHIWEDTDS